MDEAKFILKFLHFFFLIFPPEMHDLFPKYKKKCGESMNTNSSK